ncbi:DUF6777 domain-containing protein [Streptomyces sp. NPDC001984]
MSAEQPSSGRPTGPPSGPLSGPSQPSSVPPPKPPDGGGPGTGGGGSGMSGGGGPSEPEPHLPWWRSVPRMAALSAAVVAAVIVAVVLTNVGGGGSTKAGEVFLQAASETGPDPFTESTAKESSVPPPTTPPAGATAPTNEVRGVDGAAPGLYTGTRNAASCDVEKQIRSLQAEPAKNSAFASVVGVRPADVPAYLRSLTPVQLRADTRVTSHGYRDGAATSYQAVLQAGTAVMVDSHGVPRVRCTCTNPLTSPVAQRSTPKPVGRSWPAYRPSNVVVVAPASRDVDTFVIYDARHDDWFHRERGDDKGSRDQHVKPPAHWVDPVKPPSPSPSSSSPSPSSSSSSPGSSPSSPSGSRSSSPQAPSSEKPSSESPSTEKPSSESPASKPPKSEKPSTEKPSTEKPSSEKPSSEPSAPEPATSAPATSETRSSGPGVTESAPQVPPISSAPAPAGTSAPTV